MHLPASFRRRWLPRLLACAVGGAYAAHGPAQTTPRTELDRIVAIVNDDIIAGSELEARLRRVGDELRRAGTAPPAPAALRRQVLERLILLRIQLQLARDSGIRVDDEMLNRTLLRIAERDGLTLRGLRDVLERDGYDFAKFREEIREEMMISEIRKRQVENQVRISQRDIDDYLSTMARRGTEADRHRYRLGHILIAVPDGASSEEIAGARARAERVLGELRTGADFASMAVAHSDGQQALEGGDLGWRQGSDLPTIFVDAVPRLEIGGLTEPIRSTSGFHLVKLMDKRGSARQIVEQTRARHILIALDELTDDDAARRQLSALRERLVNGESFGELARVHSDDSASAPKGGELGWIDPGNTVPVFERTMDSLESGRAQRAVQIAVRMARRPGARTARARRHRGVPAGRGVAHAAGQEDRGEHAGVGPSGARRGLRGIPARRMTGRAPALTPGEPAGIGPDITLAAASSGGAPFVVFADPDVLPPPGRDAGDRDPHPSDRSPGSPPHGRSRRASYPSFRSRCRAPSSPDDRTRQTGPYVIECIRAAAEACREGAVAGLVTAPVHKGIIKRRGDRIHRPHRAPRGSGRRRTAGHDAVRPRAQGSPRHHPPPAAGGARRDRRRGADRHRPGRRARTCAPGSRSRLPRITVCGLNPHAGEGGHLGREEIESITPAVEALRAEGIDVRGPVPADTAFTRERLAGADVVVAMYHDQGLPVLKHVGFGQAVNVTLGLSFVRTLGRPRDRPRPRGNGSGGACKPPVRPGPRPRTRTGAPSRNARTRPGAMSRAVPGRNVPAGSGDACAQAIRAALPPRSRGGAAYRRCHRTRSPAS